MTSTMSCLEPLTAPMTARHRPWQRAYPTASIARAVEVAFGRFAARYPDWANSLFDRHFLRHYAAYTLAAFAAGEIDQPMAAEGIAAAWARQFSGAATTRRRRRQAELAQAVFVFLGWIVEELYRQPQGGVRGRLMTLLPMSRAR